MSATCLAPQRQVIRDGDAARWPVAVHACEQLLAAVALLIIAPALILLALLIWFLSGRAPFVAHLRAGQGARPLWVWKLRTMWNGAPVRRPFQLVERIAASGCCLKVADDPRVTSRLARLCRRYSIDELPQLLQVACGKMSLVGPRPITIGELQQHYGVHAAEVLAARPGLTGLWQVMGRNRLTYRQRLRLDLFLVRRGCLRLYFRVLLRTIPRVLRGQDAW